jgi:hypothetical protein
MLESSTTFFQPIHPNEILSRGERADFDILRIPYGFSPARLKASLDLVHRKFPWSGKDGEDSYRAIGLQYHDPKNPFLDAIDRQATYSHGEGRSLELAIEHSPFRFFDRRNLAADEFEYVFRRLIPLRVYRTRLMSVAPGFFPGNPHSDGPRSMRLHIPLETNPSAWFEIQGKRYHMPADGSAYLVNTSLVHRIGNEGSTPRTHWVSVLYKRGNIPLHPIALLAIRDFWEEHHGRDGSAAEALKQECVRRTQSRCELCWQKDSIGPHIFHVPDTKLLRSVCATCMENLIRGQKLETPGISAYGQYEDHALRESKVVEELKALLENAVEKCRSNMPT